VIVNVADSVPEPELGTTAQAALPGQLCPSHELVHVSGVEAPDPSRSIGFPELRYVPKSIASPGGSPP
jgi:hypothetical protein